MTDAELFPLFVKLAGRDVVVVGGGAMAATRVAQLAAVGARVTMVAPEVSEVAARLAAIADSSFRPLAQVVAKIRREERYHLMHLDAWMRRLGIDARDRAAARGSEQQGALCSRRDAERASPA